MMRETPVQRRVRCANDGAIWGGPPRRRAYGGEAPGSYNAVTALRGRVVTPTEVVDNGIVLIEDGRIADIRRSPGPGPATPWILPGFVDIHVHGGGGYTLTTGDPDQARAVAAFHRYHGTTTMLASLVTAPFELLHDAAAAFAPLIEEGVLAGLHLEGPYLSPARCGAQNPAWLRDPDIAELTHLIDLGGVRMVTIAPELPDALAAIRLLRRRGVVAAVGHTDATYEQTLAAIDSGATVGTHLCNAMRPVHHRDPGPIVALLDAPSVVCELVADGVHLHDGMVSHIVRAAGPDRVALVTDAMAASGMPSGEYELAGQDVTVVDGRACLAAEGILAGSTTTADAALRRSIHSGVSIVGAVTMASTTPARVLGLRAELGAIVPGLRADLVLLDGELDVIDVLRAGRPARGLWIPP
jgi:N-acetylglucosamine-6-phosphate deacetylase